MPRALAITIAVSCLTLLAGCVTRTDAPGGMAVHRCEAFFIYEICIADHDHNGSVDYIYFGDDLQIFMFVEAMQPVLEEIQPFHACAVPMSAPVRENSSQLLYAQDLPLTERLAIKGRLIADYRAAQPAIEACNARREDPRHAPRFDDPFMIDDDWDDSEGNDSP